MLWYHALTRKTALKGVMQDAIVGKMHRNQLDSPYGYLAVWPEGEYDESRAVNKISLTSCPIGRPRIEQSEPLHISGRVSLWAPDVNGFMESILKDDDTYRSKVFFRNNSTLLSSAAYPGLHELRF